MILIADSGSTKTAWGLCDEETNEVTLVNTQGINPFQQEMDDICSVLRDELVKSLSARGIEINGIEQIYFYGAGCTAEKSPIVAEALRRVVSGSGQICVESDMLGAARGLCGHEAGIVCILGTGSNSCYYDGERITANVSPLGYILGDEGSGAYIGKRLVGDVLKHQMPSDICNLFFKEIHETQASIIQKVYREPLANRFLASLSPFCARHREHEAIHSFLIDCFAEFFKRNIDCYSTLVAEGDLSTAHFIGSIAYYYQSEIAEAASRCGYRIGNIAKAPLQGLIAFHTNLPSVLVPSCAD